MTVVMVWLKQHAAHAADTVEPFDIGPTNLELYVGVEGVNPGSQEKSFYSETVFGAGILERMSVYTSLTAATNEYLVEGAVGFGFGVYGNVFDSDHFDADLFLSISGGRAEDYAVTPAFELNLDSVAGGTGIGVYLRGGALLYGRDVASEDSVEPHFEYATCLESIIGAYGTLGDSHQLFAEFDMLFRPDALDNERTIEAGAIALGYNVMLADNLELINHVYTDILHYQERFQIGFFIGFVATLPAGR